MNTIGRILCAIVVASAFVGAFVLKPDCGQLEPRITFREPVNDIHVVFNVNVAELTSSVIVGSDDGMHAITMFNDRLLILHKRPDGEWYTRDPRFTTESRFGIDFETQTLKILFTYGN